MKKLIALIMFMFLVLPMSANAGACARYWDDLVKQSFATTIDGIEFTAYFSDSYFGPCPGGRVVVSYMDVQVIDGIEYTAEVEVEFYYTTTPGIVTIAELDFLLVEGKLILLPENSLIFNVIGEEKNGIVNPS